MHDKPFIKITIAFTTGLLIAKFLPPLFPVTYYLLATFSLFILFLLFKFIATRPSRLFTPSVVVIFFLLSAGYATYLIKETSIKKENIKFSQKQKGVILAKVIQEPKIYEKVIKNVLEVEAIKNGKIWTKANGKIIVYFRDSLAKELLPGDLIILNPSLKNIETAKNPEEFDYKQYLTFHLILKQAYLQAGEWEKLNGNTSVIDQIKRFRTHLVKVIEKSSLSYSQKAIVEALTLGYKGNLDAQIKSKFSTTGTMHLLAVSGLHVGIIFIILNYLLFPFSNNKLKIIKFVIVITLLWSYAILSGLSPSVTRATLMFSLIQIGTLFKRKPNVYNIIAVSAFIIELANPFVINEIGFWLSYSAVIGILILYKPLYDIIFIPTHKNFIYNILDKIWSLICVSLAAQIATFPFTVYFFHNFPVYFLIANLIVIPIVPFIMYFSLGMFVFDWQPAIFKFFSNLTAHSISFMEYVLLHISKFPYSILDNLHISTIQFTLLILMIIAFILFFSYKQSKAFLILLFLLALFITDNIIQINNGKGRKVFVAYNIRGYSAYNFIDGNDNLFFTDFYEHNKQIEFAAKNYWLSLGLKKEKLIPLDKLNSTFLFSNFWVIDNPAFFYYKNYMKFYNLKLMTINDKYFLPKILPNKKLKLDYIILRHNPKISIKKLPYFFNFKRIIFDSSNSPWLIKKWKTECKQNNIPYYNISEQGAFVLSMK